jgi:integrase
MNIQKTQRSDGTLAYRVRVRDRNRKWFPAKTFGRRADAEQYARKLITARDIGETATPFENRSLVVGEYFEQWIAHRQQRVSLGWYRQQCQLAEWYIIPVIGSIRLGEVRPHHVGVVLDKMYALNRSAQTVRHVYNMMHKMFDDAVEYFEVLPRSPVKKCDRPKVHQTERNFLHPTEAWKLLNVARHHYLGAGIWLGIFAGLRISEIQALTWSAVDFISGQIHIRAAYKRHAKCIEPYPKQKDWGKAQMAAALVDFLKPLSVGKKPTDLVVTAARGGMLEYKKFYDGLKVLCAEADVTILTPHELRHSCSEMWIDAGASREDIRRQLNHKRDESLRPYIHRTDDRLASIALEIKGPKLYAV